MAKQNFLAGGFYGKLGATVGQRWRNKRTLRVYVKTPNPDTPDQRANRGRFAQAIHAAQKALVFNNGTQAFYTEGLTEFQYRTSTAKQRIDAGLTGFAVLPLFPNNYTPAIQVTGLSHTMGTGNTVNFQSVDYPIATAPRKVMVEITLQNDTTLEYEEVRQIVTLQTTGDNLFTFVMPSGYSLGTESTIFGVSTDDADYNDNMVYIPQTACGQAVEVSLDDFVWVGYEEQYVLATSAKLSAIAKPLTLSLTGSFTNGCAIERSEFTIQGTFNPSVDQYIRFYLKDPFVVNTGDSISTGQVQTVVTGYTFTIPEQEIDANLGERYWVGENEAVYDWGYNSTQDTDDNAVFILYSDKGQGMTNQKILKGSYPYRDSTGLHTATLNVNGQATIDGSEGLSYEEELLVTPDYPEQAGDTMQIEKAGVGGPLFFYGVSNKSLNMA